MATSVFADKASPPDTRELAAALGPAGTWWEELVTALAARYEPLTETWKFGGKQWGWTLQLKRRKRTVLYLTPCEGHFIAGFALGEKAVKAAPQSDLPASVLTVIDEARKYAEGRAVRLEVRRKVDIESVEKIAAAKMAN